MLLLQGGEKPLDIMKPLEVRRVLGWFIVLGLGLIIALFITICEVYCKKPKKQRTPEEIVERQTAREAKKSRSKGKKDKAEEVETQQLTAHEAPIGNSQMDDATRMGVGIANAADDATLKKGGGCSDQDIFRLAFGLNWNRASKVARRRIVLNRKPIKKAFRYGLTKIICHQCLTVPFTVNT